MRVIIIVILTITSFHLAAQHSYLPSVKTLTTEDGLSSNTVNAIHKDQRGFIWIGTEYGLNRYDGQEFEFFSKDNEEHMTVDTVHKIAEDGQGFLWILKTHKRYEHDYSYSELNIFDIAASKAIDINTYFEDELPFDIKHITLLDQLDNETLVIHILKDRKAYTFRKGEGFKDFPIPEEFYYFRDVYQLPNGDFLMSGFERNAISILFYKVSKDGKDIQKLDNFRFDIISNGATRQFAANFWTLSAYHHLDINTTIPPAFASILVNTYPYIEQGDYNEKAELFWLREKNQINVINKDREVIFKLPYQNVTSKEKLLPVIFDGEKTWFSDGINGIQIIILQPNHFNNTIPFSNNASNSMRGLYLDKNGDTWFSTIGDVGIIRKNGQQINLNEFSGWFTTFLEDKKGNLWRGGYDKICKHQGVSETAQEYTNTTGFGFFGTYYEANNGNIWVTKHDTIFVFNPNTETFQKPIVVKRTLTERLNIYAIQTVGQTDKVWICTSQGLFLYKQDGSLVATYGNNQTEEFYLPANDFHHMYQEKDGTIWLATGDGGLISWQSAVGSEQKTIKQFTISNGLSSNALHAVYEDDYNYLWISSDNGLMQFDKKSEQITKYFKNNGTVENEFNRASHHQAKDGTLLFGTINGWTSFHPKNYADTREKQKAPQLTFKVFQQFSSRASDLVDLTEQLLKKSTITLRPNDRFFNIHLSLLDFYNGRNSTFTYRVKGVYDWQTSKNPILNFSSLPYGTHTLEIKAQNGNGQQAANNLVFKVRVMRPFYLRWWFVLLIIGTMGAGLFYYIRWRTEQLLVAQETAQLRNLDKLKTKFFANISHELRTPITLILAPLSQLRKKEQLTNADKPSLDKIYKNGQNLLNLVNEILDLSKLEADRLELQTQPTTIPQFFHRISAQFESAARVKNIDYQFVSTLSHDLTIQLDRSKMEKIINNLLSNAIKFTPKSRKGSGGQIQMSLIEIKGSDTSSYIQIKVKDSGRGIPAEDIPHIFDRYFQSNSRDVTPQRLYEGGTGIGLALTKELVELMGGQISVQSKIGEGTVFEIKMPYQLAVNQSAVEDNIYSVGFKPYAIDIEKSQPKTSTEKDNILLVEDNPSLQEFIYSTLSPHYNVTITSNGIEALEQLAVRSRQLAENSEVLPTTNYQLVLSDVMMPEMDGFTLLEHVKANDDFCSIPFILLTARADIQDKLHGLRIGVDDYMTKPFEVEELLLRIRNLIANAKNRIVEEVIQIKDKDTETEKSKIKKAKPNKPKAAGQKPQTETRKVYVVTNQDLDWLKQVEEVALREIHNKQFKQDDLAIELFVSKRQLIRRVKQITGMTPNRYIRSIRLHRAKILLETREISNITEVTYAIGFEGVTHFSRLFEEEFGKHPKSYLK